MRQFNRQRQTFTTMTYRFRRKKDARNQEEGAEIKQPVYVVLVPEVAAYASAASFPVDSAGKLVFLNDTVEHEGGEYQVVAMSHRNKVVIRPKGQTYGGKWVKAGSVRVTRHVLGVR